MKAPPKALEKLMVFYPGLQALWVLSELAHWIRIPSVTGLLRLIFASYLLSPLLWRLLRWSFRQPTEGSFRIGKHAAGGNLWISYYQLQSLYTHFPVFERFLRLFPGVYSAWLRLWGSRIGNKVNWTPECQLVDRGHLEIGDRVFLGNRSYLSAHAIKKINQRYLLYVKRIRIGADAMLSYSSHVGPGVEIGERAHIEPGAGLYLNTQVEKGATYGSQARR